MKKFLTLFSAGMFLLGLSSAPRYAQAQGPVPSHICNDNNQGSLQRVIDNLPPGATLFVGGTCIGQIVLSKDIHLRGFRTRTTLSAPGSSGVVIVQFPAHAVISRLDIDAAESDGGVIANVGVVVKLDDVEARNGPVGLFLGHGSAADIFKSTFLNQAIEGIVVKQNSTAMIRGSTFDGGGMQGEFGACIRVVEVSSIALLLDDGGNTIRNCYAGLEFRDAFVFSHGTTYTGNTAFDIRCGAGGVIDPQTAEDFSANILDIQDGCRAPLP